MLVDWETMASAPPAVLFENTLSEMVTLEVLPRISMALNEDIVNGLLLSTIAPEMVTGPDAWIRMAPCADLELGTFPVMVGLVSDTVFP